MRYGFAKRRVCIRFLRNGTRNRAQNEIKSAQSVCVSFGMGLQKRARLRSVLRNGTRNRAQNEIKARRVFAFL